jgi:hypothetical protein
LDACFAVAIELKYLAENDLEKIKPLAFRTFQMLSRLINKEPLQA